MLPHEAEDLLIQNQTYINAIQRASVSLYHLGFEDLSLRSSTSEDDNNIMKAVIPNDNQVDFLDNIDKGLRHMTFAHFHRRYRDKRLPRIRTPIHSNKVFNLEEAKQLFPKPEVKPSNPFLHGQIPHYAKSTHRMQEWDEEVIKRAKEKEEHQKRLKSTSSDQRYDIILKNGQKYVYNPMTGKLITLEEATRLKKQQERSKSFRHNSSSSRLITSLAQDEEGQEKVVFKGLIIEKTSRYVDSLRKSIEEERKSRRHHEIPNTLVEWPKHLLHIWPEYNLLEEGDVLLTIEHCHSCNQHDEHTHHKEEKYIEQAELVINLTKSIAEHYGIRFFAVMKPIELPSALELSVERSINHKLIESSEYRIGAFEVQIAFKRFGYESYTAHTLHSKLYTGQWPKISILQRQFLQLLDQSGYEVVQTLPDEFLDANTVYGMLGISTTNNNTSSGSGKHRKGIRRSISRSHSPVSRLRSRSRSRSRSPSSSRQQPTALGNALVDQKKEPKHPPAILLPPSSTGKTKSSSFSSMSPQGGPPYLTTTFEKRNNSQRRDDFAEAVQMVIASVQENSISNDVVGEEQEEEEEEEKELNCQSPPIPDSKIQPLPEESRRIESTMESTRSLRDRDSQVVGLTAQTLSESLPPMTENHEEEQHVDSVTKVELTTTTTTPASSSLLSPIAVEQTSSEVLPAAILSNRVQDSSELTTSTSLQEKEKECEKHDNNNDNNNNDDETEDVAEYEDDYETISNPRSRSCSVQNPFDSPLREDRKRPGGPVLREEERELVLTPNKLEVSSTALTPPYTPITPHAVISTTTLHDDDDENHGHGQLDGISHSIQSDMNTSFERSDTIQAIVSLPLLPIQEDEPQQQQLPSSSSEEGRRTPSLLEEKKSLDINQAREARKSVMLLQEMLNKDAISLRQSIQLSTDDEFWSKLENSLNIASPEK